MILISLCAVCIIAGGGWFAYSRLHPSSRSAVGNSAGNTALTTAGPGVSVSPDGTTNFMLPIGGDSAAAFVWLKNNLFAEDYYATVNSGFAPIVQDSVSRAPLDGYTMGQNASADGQPTPSEEPVPTDEPTPTSKPADDEPSPTPDLTAPDKSLPEQDVTDWPKDYVPKDIPPYTDGNLSGFAQSGLIYLSIDNTNHDAYQNWLNGLLKAGYTITPNLSGTGSTSGNDFNEITKGNWAIECQWNGANSLTIEILYTN